jgi:glutaredoxin
MREGAALISAANELDEHRAADSANTTVPHAALRRPGRAYASMVDDIKAKNKENPVMVYSKSYCPYCASVKGLFRDLEVQHKVVELDQIGARTTALAPLHRYRTRLNLRLAARMVSHRTCTTQSITAGPPAHTPPKRSHALLFGAADGLDVQDTLLDVTGSHTVPQVFIAGEFIGGASETNSLHDQGGLLPKLDAAGVSHK